MSEIHNHPVYSKNVLEMLTVANDFCLTLRKPEALKRHELIEYMTRICPLLYLKGTLLPEIDVSNPDINERFFTQEEWEGLFNSLRIVFGKDDIFWYADPESSDEMIKGSMAEHMTDIFQDLQDFLLLYQKSMLDAKENAVNELFTLFIGNWGPKLLRTQKPLHKLFFKVTPPQSGFNIPSMF